MRQDDFRVCGPAVGVGAAAHDRRYYPLICGMLELDIPFCTQVGHAGSLGNPRAGWPIPYLDRVALEFPELRIVGGHIGAPWLGEMLSLVMKSPNVFIDTSAYKVGRYPKELVDYMRGSAKHRILFGSNHPFWPAGECLADLDALNLGALPRPHSSRVMRNAYSSSTESGV